MASRLYRTTRLLFLSVEHALRRLRIADLGTPTLAVLIAWAVTGLLLLDARPTHTRVARMLPGRCHDALNRLLRDMPWSTRALTKLVVACATRLDCDGYLVLDEVIVEKAFAKRLPWAASIYSFAKKRTVWGFQIVVLVWCSVDGLWRIPVGFRLWRPKRSCRADRYHTKLELALELVTAVALTRLPVQYLVGDTHYTAGWFTKRLARLGVVWHGTLNPKTHVVWRGERQPVRELAGRLKLPWREHLGVRARAMRVYAPKYGQLRLVVTSNRHGNFEYLVSNDRTLDLTTMVQRKRSRWSVEIVFSQVTKADIHTGFGRWNDIADFDLVVRHDHAVDQEFEQLPALLKRCLVQATPDVRTEGLNRWNGDTGLRQLLTGPFELPHLCLEVVAVVHQFALPAFKFSQFNRFCQIGSKQAITLAVEAVKCLLDCHVAVLNLLREPRPALCPLQRTGNHFGMLHNHAQVLPDDRLQLISWTIAGAAALVVRAVHRIVFGPAQIVVIGRRPKVAMAL